MTILLIWSVLLGANLGRFFKVLILVPASAFILAVVIVRSTAVGHDLLHLLLEFAMVNATLQIGYVSGLLSLFIPSVPQHQKKLAGARPLLRL